MNKSIFTDEWYFSVIQDGSKIKSDEASWRLDDGKFQFKLQWFVLSFANCCLVFYLCVLGTSLQGKNCATLYNWGMYSRVPIARGFSNIRHGFIVASHIDLRYKAFNVRRLWQNSSKTNVLTQKHTLYRSRWCLSNGTREYCLHLYINLYQLIPSRKLKKKESLAQRFIHPQFGLREPKVEFDNWILALFTNL